MTIRTLVLQHDGTLRGAWRDDAGALHMDDAHPPIVALTPLEPIGGLAGAVTLPALAERQNQIVATLNKVIAALGGRTA